MYSAGDILLAEFPFSDNTGSKTRNFLVIAVVGNYYWGLMMGSSSKIDDGFIYQLKKEELDFETPKETCVRCNIIQTIDKSIIKKKFGKMHNETFERIMNIVRSNLT
jgi:hypothetical protein